MREAWRELMFADEDQEAKQTKNPVAPAQRSETATRETSREKRNSQMPPHSFSTMLDSLATIAQNRCFSTADGNHEATFIITTNASDLQERAMECIKKIKM